MATASCTTRGRSCPTRKAGTDCTASGAGRSSDLMAAVPMMTFPVEWVVIDGNRVVYYPWQVLPDPKGGDELYRFGCVTILEYAGDGQFSYQEDMYNPSAGEEVFGRWLAAGGELAAPPDALGL